MGIILLISAIFFLQAILVEHRKGNCHSTLSSVRSRTTTHLYFFTIFVAPQVKLLQTIPMTSFRVYFNVNAASSIDAKEILGFSLSSGSTKTNEILMRPTTCEKYRLIYHFREAELGTLAKIQVHCLSSLANCEVLLLILALVIYDSY
jgi:hypothetical protein